MNIQVLFAAVSTLRNMAQGAANEFEAVSVPPMTTTPASLRAEAFALGRSHAYNQAAGMLEALMEAELREEEADAKRKGNL